MLGRGTYTYTPVDHWGNFPDEIILGDVAGIAVDAKDFVYLFNRGEHPVVVLSQHGEVLRTWGHGIFKNPHGASIGFLKIPWPQVRNTSPCCDKTTTGCSPLLKR